MTAAIVPDHHVAAAQARRDRQRILAAEAEIAELGARLAALERSISFRLLGPARRAMRWLQGTAPAPAPAASGRGLALILDHDWPQPDRDAGSMEIVLLAQSLHRLGFEVILAASRQHEGEQPARDRLEAGGIRCLRPAQAASVERFIVERGPAADLVVLCRVFCGGEFLELAQRHCRRARLVFDSIDLNYLREERRATLLGDTALLALIPQIRAREEHVIRGCDATLVVSQAEAELLGRTVPDALAAFMPLARAVQPPAMRFAARRDIGFIGNFGHAPNLDAMRHFLDAIWPLVRRALPDCTLSVVGPGAPPDLAQGHDGSVRVLGHVADVAPWFAALRLTVAPLRFGAGAKGKVASSLAAGVPCVATAVAAEGMALREEAGVLVADTPEGFAAAVTRAYTDEALWDRLSAGALAYAGAELSPDAWQARLEQVLLRIGL